MRRTIGILLVGCVAALSLAQQSHAAPLISGAIGASLEAEPTGGSVIASLLSPFTVPGKFSGTLLSEVYQGDTSNPYGGLTFVYTLSNTSVLPESNPITAVTINGYTGSLTDVSYNTPGHAPTSIDRLTPDTVGFRFPEPLFIPGFGFFGAGTLLPGMTSASLIVQSDLPSYTTNVAQVIDGAVINVAALVPVIPEPSTLVLAGLGVALAGLAVRRKR